jgi:hypothetical protein
MTDKDLVMCLGAAMNAALRKRLRARMEHRMRLPILQHMGSEKVFKRSYLNQQFRARAWAWFYRFRE